MEPKDDSIQDQEYQMESKETWHFRQNDIDTSKERWYENIATK